VAPARLQAYARSTDFFVVTSEEVFGPQYRSSLVLSPQISHIPFSLEDYRRFSNFADSIGDCVLVGLVDQASCVIIESKLNDLGRTLEAVQYVDANTANSSAVTQAALDTLQTALAMGRANLTSPEGQSGAGALVSFYAWL